MQNDELGPGRGLRSVGGMQSGARALPHLGLRADLTVVSSRWPHWLFVRTRMLVDNTLCQRIAALLLSLGFVVAVIGVPAPARVAPKSGADFPCKHHACGCLNAEMCRTHCCCFPHRGSAKAGARGAKAKSCCAGRTKASTATKHEETTRLHANANGIRWLIGTTDCKGVQLVWLATHLPMLHSGRLAMGLRPTVCQGLQADEDEAGPSLFLQPDTPPPRC